MAGLNLLELAQSCSDLSGPVKNEAGVTFDNSFFQKRDLLTVEVNQFWIVEEKPVERNTCTRQELFLISLNI